MKLKGLSESGRDYPTADTFFKAMEVVGAEFPEYDALGDHRIVGSRPGDLYGKPSHIFTMIFQRRESRKPTNPADDWEDTFDYTPGVLAKLEIRSEDYSNLQVTDVCGIPVYYTNLFVETAPESTKANALQEFLDQLKKSLVNYKYL